MENSEEYIGKYNFCIWFGIRGSWIRNKLGEMKFWQEFERVVEQERPSINFILPGMKKPVKFIFTKREKRQNENGILYDRYYFKEVI